MLIEKSSFLDSWFIFKNIFSSIHVSQPITNKLNNITRTKDIEANAQGFENAQFKYFSRVHREFQEGGQDLQVPDSVWSTRSEIGVS